MSDDFLFADDVEEEEIQHRGSWKVLIVDDEPEVHAVTKLAFSDFIFQDRDIEFLSAHSGADAKRLMQEHDDIAVVLLDVVMETDDAGLQVADFIRNDVQNTFTRIILRTGQPGQAPEREVIVNYDINDYKSKTELTAQKLFTVVISALRSYRDIINIEESRKGLEMIINSSNQLFNIGSMDAFMDNLSHQLESLLGQRPEVSYLTTALPTSNNLNNYIAYSRSIEDASMKAFPAGNMDKKVLDVCQMAIKKQGLTIQNDVMVAFCEGGAFNGALLVISGLPEHLEKNEQILIDVFANNVQAAFEKLQLAQNIESSHDSGQMSIFEHAGKELECRLNRGRHVHRVTLICERLGEALGLPRKDLEILSLAFRLHNIGNLVIPMSILTKSGDLTPEEIKVIRRQIDEEIDLLKDAQHSVIKTTALLASEQYEKWDGSGYPNGLSGEQLHIFSRIVTLADVFDRLSSASEEESEPLPPVEVIEQIKAQKGKQFDPQIVDILLNDIAEFEYIIEQNPDNK